MEIFGHTGKLGKNIKNQATRSNWSKVGHHGPLGGIAQPHNGTGWHGTSSATSPIYGKWPRNIPQAFSTVDSKSVHDQGPKRGNTWIDDSPSGMSGAQLDKWCSYTHSTTPQEAPHKRRRAHSIVAIQPAPYLCGPAPLSGSTTSPSDTCKETHFGATWCVDLWWFKVGLIQGQGEGVTWIDDVALE